MHQPAKNGPRLTNTVNTPGTLNAATPRSASTNHAFFALTHHPVAPVVVKTSGAQRPPKQALNITRPHAYYLKL